MLCSLGFRMPVYKDLIKLVVIVTIKSFPMYSNSKNHLQYIPIVKVINKVFLE